MYCPFGLQFLQICPFAGGEEKQGQIDVSGALLLDKEDIRVEKEQGEEVEENNGILLSVHQKFQCLGSFLRSLR